MSPIQALLTPISESRPGGIDLTFHESLDAIREARRGDDPGLSQGAWVTEVKRADWSKVRTLTETLLREQSKDLQIAGWFLEAQARLNGFPGLTTGFQLMQGLLEGFWEALHPGLEEGLELRVGRMEWLANLLPELITSLPLVEGAQGSHRYQDWVVARLREHAARSDADFSESDQPTLDQLDAALKRLGASAGQRRLEELQQALEAFKALERVMEARFGEEAPLFDRTQELMEGCLALFQSAFGAPSTLLLSPVLDTPGVRVETPMPSAASDRQRALEGLRAAVAYYRRHEPHSPVGPLVERALAWSQLSLDAWLQEVIGEESTLVQVRSLLGFSARHAD